MENSFESFLAPFIHLPQLLSKIIIFLHYFYSSFTFPFSYRLMNFLLVLFTTSSDFFSVLCCCCCCCVDVIPWFDSVHSELRDWNYSDTLWIFFFSSFMFCLSHLVDRTTHSLHPYIEVISRHTFKQH